MGSTGNKIIGEVRKKVRGKKYGKKIIRKSTGKKII
jgi:hypothetical protein